MILQGWHHWRTRDKRFGELSWIWGAPHELHGYNYGLHVRRDRVLRSRQFCAGPLYGFLTFPRVRR